MINAGDGLLDEYGGVVDDAIVDALREARLELLHFRLDRISGGDGVGTGHLKDRERRCGIAIVLGAEITVDVIVLGAQLDPALDDIALVVELRPADDVLEEHVLSLVAGLHDDLLELFGVRETTLRVDRQIKRNGRALRHRRLADSTGGNLHVLFLDRLDHIAAGHPERRQPLRIEPDAHAVIARAEKRHIAHARNACQVVLHVECCEVAR